MTRDKMREQRGGCARSAGQRQLQCIRCARWPWRHRLQPGHRRGGLPHEAGSAGWVGKLADLVLGGRPSSASSLSFAGVGLFAQMDPAHPYFAALRRLFRWPMFGGARGRPALPAHRPSSRPARR